MFLTTCGDLAMHEIRATVAPEQVEQTVSFARAVGIERVAVSEIYLYGPDSSRRIVSVEASTPRAKAFLDAVLSSSVAKSDHFSITSRELRALIDGGDVGELTQPMSEPHQDVLQDLWQLTHATASYWTRAAAGGLLLGTGIIDNNPVAIVVAALFLPFLSDVLAVAFGFWIRDRRLILRGIRAVIISSVLAFSGGAVAEWFSGDPISYTAFKGPLAGMAISAVIGVTAGLSNADDTGRRYLIGVAAAVQLAIIPAWLGAALIAGTLKTGRPE
jgi:hypothetical protein